jgi:hypothetical protein
MARRCTDLPGQDPQLSRKRTADMLRQLRNLGKDARMLKARLNHLHSRGWPVAIKAPSVSRSEFCLQHLKRHHSRGLFTPSCVNW